MTTKIQLKKDFTCYRDGQFTRFKKDEILTPAQDSDEWQTTDGRSISSEEVKHFTATFKPL